jgi:hypothetical protein
MRFALVVVGLALLAGCGGDDEETAAPSPSGGAALAELTITVDEDGEGGAAAKTSEVTCEAAGDSAICGVVAKLPAKVFEEPSGTTACTQQFGGPETATVEGTINGDPVSTRFSRENGCQIARWDAAKELLEAAG